MENDGSDEGQQRVVGSGAKRRTTFWLDDEDRAALARIRRRYGLSTDADALRLAIRLVDAAPHLARLEREGQDDDDGTQ